MWNKRYFLAIEKILSAPIIKTLTFSFLLVISFGEINGQPPSSSIWKIDLTIENEGLITLDNYTLVSGFKSDGYNNQPWFKDENIFLFSASEGIKTNIFKADLSSGKLQQITATEESEFSPQMQKNDQYYSWIRLEKDGSQRLWHAPANHSTYGYPITPIDLKVGYYQWLDEHALALFVLRENHNELIIWENTSGKEKFLAKDPGRCLQTGDKGLLYYTVQRGQKNLILYSYDHQTGRSNMLLRMPAGSSGDFCNGPDGLLLTFSGEYLLGFRPGLDSSWKNLARLRGMEDKKISRMAYNGQGKLIFVVDEN